MSISGMTRTSKHTRRMYFFVATIFVGLLAGPLSVEARVTRFVVEQARVYAGGESWGEAGPYEHITGRAYHEVDPSDPRNAMIVNIDKAPRNNRGMVEFDTPVFILKPAEMARGNGKIFYNVNNRGNTDVGFQTTAAEVSRHVALQLRRGFTLIDAGWHGDGEPNARQLFPAFPVATQPDGSPIVSPLRLEFSGMSLFGPAGYSQPFVPFFRPYETADTDTRQSRLVVRDRAGAPARPIADDDWAFGDCPTGRDSLKPSKTSICLFEKFDTDKLYELTYPAKNPVVMGLGYAVTRDVGAFFRNQRQDDEGNPNPLAQPGDKQPARLAYVYGASSTGMYLRDWLYLGFNEDKESRKVFDGVFIHTGGALRLFANVEFAHPTFYAAQDNHQDYLSNAYPPFTYGVTVDPLTKVKDGILKRPKTDPVLMEVVDENSFWQWKNSLQVVDGLGNSLPIDEKVRLYFKSGSGHLGIHGIMSSPTTPHGYSGECRYEAQALAIGKTGPSIAGSLMVALDEWVDQGIEPPASNYPTRDNGLLISMAEYQQQFPKIPGLELPAVMAELNVLDYGPQFSAEGGRLNGQPPKKGEAYALFVPRPDQDGMAVSKIRPMEVAAPIGSNIGWNIRRKGYREGDLCGLEGTFIPFAETRAERIANKDPRLSLEERYGDHKGFVKAVKTAAKKLVAQRFLLPEDAEEWIAAAEASEIIKTAHKRQGIGFSLIQKNGSD